MLLNSAQIAERLHMDPDEDEALRIAPLPDLNELRDRQSASVDLRLGTWFLAPRTSRASHYDDEPVLSERVFARKTFVPLGGRFILHPNEFVLAVTLEWIKLRGALAGYVTGKSSWGRRGLVIETAAGVHPWYSGCLTLEVANIGQLPITVVPGMRICQLFVHRMDEPAAECPAGSYARRRQPTLGAIQEDKLVQRLRGPVPSSA